MYARGDSKILGGYALLTYRANGSNAKPMALTSADTLNLVYRGSSLSQERLPLGPNGTGVTRE